MSFSALRDIFIGSIGADYCVKALLWLKSPNNIKKYLLGIHKITFPEGDTIKSKIWYAYPRIEGAPNVTPIKSRDLSDSNFMNKQANKLSFDISRFIEFYTSHIEVDDDIKPIMLHYATIYLFDFFSRTWLKYSQNWGHGMRFTISSNDFSVRIKKSGIFPRAIDAFYFSGQSSLFSLDDDYGIGYQLNIKGETVSERIGKMKYSECPEVTLTHLIDVYEKLGKIVGSVSESNPTLVGYAILFILSSISRYRAEDWFKIREDRNLKNKFDLLQYDFLYKWTHGILMQTILKRGLKKELSISE